MDLLFGNQSWRHVLLVILPGVLAGGLVLFFHPSPHDGIWLTVIFTIDLISGLIANNLPSVHRAWQARPSWWAYTFIAVHTLVYPVLLFWVEKNFLVLGSLLLVLTVKLYSFIRGYYLT
jgi:hypothetical protein